MALRGREQHVDESVFFVTTAVQSHARVFTADRYCDLFIENIKHYQRRYRFEIHGYVIMPSHFHWIVSTNPSLGSISAIMRDLKKYAAWEIMSALEMDHRDDLIRIFRGAGHDGSGQARKFWTERFDDEAIRNVGMFRAKLAYIHDNPVRAGLVQSPEDFKYSSARNYLLGDHSVLYVETELWK